MKIEMLVDVRGPIDGKNLGQFKNGQVYTVEAKTARLFIGSAMALEYKEPVPTAADAPTPDPVRDAMGYPV